MYLYGLAVQGNSRVHGSIQQTHGVGVEEEGCHQGDVLGPAPGLQQAQGPLLCIPTHAVKNHVKPEGGDMMRPSAI